MGAGRRGEEWGGSRRGRLHRSRSWCLAAACLLVLSTPSTAAAAFGDITTFAGTGTGGFNGDNQLATTATLRDPHGILVAADGAIIVSDFSNHRVRRISPAGVITTIAGTGAAGYNGDNIAATTAQLNSPLGLALASDGAILIVDMVNNRLRRISPGGMITTIAGTGTAGYNGDNIAATSANLNLPTGLAVTPDDRVLIADTGNHRVRQVSVGGVITTIAGTGTSGYNGDNQLATAAQLHAPREIKVASDGGILVAERDGARIRRIAPGGIITTIAGTGTGGYNGDNIPATTAQINSPRGLGFAPDGSILISDHSNHRLRRVAPDGTITTIAGTGTLGYNGDGIDATTAHLNQPRGIAVTSVGDVLLADSNNQRLRQIDLELIAPPAPIPSPTPTPTPTPTPDPSPQPTTTPPTRPLVPPPPPLIPDYLGPTNTVSTSVAGAQLALDVPRGCVRPGQTFTATLRYRKQRRKGNLFVKLTQVDFSEGAHLLVRDRKPTFRHAFRVPLSQRPETTISVRARAFIKVRKGPGPKKSIRATIKVCA